MPWTSTQLLGEGSWNFVAVAVVVPSCALARLGPLTITVYSCDDPKTAPAFPP